MLIDEDELTQEEIESTIDNETEKEKFAPMENVEKYE